jgi:hypothetical protein
MTMDSPKVVLKHLVGGKNTMNLHGALYYITCIHVRSAINMFNENMPKHFA